MSKEDLKHDVASQHEDDRMSTVQESTRGRRGTRRTEGGSGEKGVRDDGYRVEMRALVQ